MKVYVSDPSGHMYTDGVLLVAETKADKVRLEKMDSRGVQVSSCRWRFDRHAPSLFLKIKEEKKK